MQQEQQGNPYQEEEQENLKFLIAKYAHYWPWFIFSVVLCFILAFAYTRYATEIYSTQSEVKILKEQENTLDMSGLQGASTLFDMNKVNLENEMEILKSRRLATSVVGDLNLTTSYFSEGNIKTVELFGNQVPFTVNWIEIQPTEQQKKEPAPTFYVSLLANDNFKVKWEDGTSKKGTFGTAVHFPGYDFILTRNPGYTDEKSSPKEFLFKNVPEARAVDKLITNVNIQPVGKQSEVLNLSMQGANIGKNEAILNALTEQFNKDGIQDKQLISKRTQEFVEERLEFLVGELDTVESGLVNFKRDNNLVSIEGNTQQLFMKEAGAESKRFELETQQSVTKSFKESLINGEQYNLLPANIGIEKGEINSFTEQYNESVLQREKLLISSTQDNPMVINLESRLDRLKQNIISSVNSYIQSINISLKSFQDREKASSGNLSAIPEKTKAIRSIRRQQEIKEKLYLFLLQKREEAALTYATTAPTIKMVDYAYTQPAPIAPKKAIIYLAALILGGLLPFGFLYLKFLLNTKITSKDQITRQLPNTPIIAEIPHASKYETTVLQANDRSVIAEAFRIFRTNLAYFKSAKNQQDGQVIYVTSSTKGEGKTFTSINLASSLASTGKKVLIVGCDLRNPQLHNYVNKGKNAPGLSSYLVNPATDLNQLIHHEVAKIKNLDLMLSGEIPPNPAELLLNGNFESFIKIMRAQYDYVIVDTAPTILVTDTLLISQEADLTVYVMRANYTEAKLIQHIKDMKSQQKLRNIGIVLNGVDGRGGYGYNYGYGYGYAEDNGKKSRWKFWKKA